MPIDYFDYTLLQKKGLLKIEEEPKEENVKIDNQGFVDFTQSANSVSSSTASVSSASSAPVGDMFGFLDSPTSSSANSSSSAVYGNSSISSSSGDTNSDINALRLKLDDTEYKLERLIERLARIEEKIGII